MGLYEQLPPRQYDRGVENRRPAQGYHQREYDSYHPGSNAHPPLPDYPFRQPAIAPYGRRTDRDERRPPSPVTSFLDQIELDNGRLAKAPDSIPLDYPAGRHGDQLDCDISASKSMSCNILKRAAQSPVLNSKVDYAIKRLRKTVKDDESGSKVKASARPAAGIQPKVKEADHTIKQSLASQRIDIHKSENTRLYVNASTQTENIRIPSPKLVALQEEEAIAQARHEAEMARRKQALALELEYERKILGLRHHYNQPTKTTRMAQPASVTNSSHSPEHSTPFEVQKGITDDILGSKSPRRQDCQVTVQQSPVAPQGCVKPDLGGEGRGTVTKPALDPSSPLDRKTQKPVIRNPNPAKGEDQNSSAQEFKDQLLPYPASRTITTPLRLTAALINFTPARSLRGAML
ncbi:MAG: hypothetical protein Q9216_005248 [Gyalolechia sp. 2 TL-2023]